MDKEADKEGRIDLKEEAIMEVQMAHSHSDREIEEERFKNKGMIKTKEEVEGEDSKDKEDMLTMIIERIETIGILKLTI